MKFNLWEYFSPLRWIISSFLSNGGKGLWAPSWLIRRDKAKNIFADAIEVKLIEQDSLYSSSVKEEFCPEAWKVILPPWKWKVCLLSEMPLRCMLSTYQPSRGRTRRFSRRMWIWAPSKLMGGCVWFQGIYAGIAERHEVRMSSHRCVYCLQGFLQRTRPTKYVCRLVGKSFWHWLKLAWWGKVLLVASLWSQMIQPISGQISGLEVAWLLCHDC